jgi:hypothetical protein
MRTLEDVRGRCRIDAITRCWEWTGASHKGIARVYAPDWTILDGALRPQAGRRGVWHIQNPGKGLPSGWRVYGTCDIDLCLNPAHAEAGPAKAQGAQIAQSGRYKGQMARILANRANGRKRSALTPELVTDILGSDETHAAAGRRTGISEDVVRNVRTGRGARCLQPLGGMFSALIKQPQNATTGRNP